MGEVALAKREKTGRDLVIPSALPPHPILLKVKKGGSSGIFWGKFIGEKTLGVAWDHRSVLAQGDSDTVNAPIRVGWVSPLRVATGGAANCGSGARPRRSPAHANTRRNLAFCLINTGFEGFCARMAIG
jgi:hypothetical protein